jgi:hypothetical protein
VTKLNSIEAATALPRNRIFIGERGCTVDNTNRANCFEDHATNSFDWGVSLWIVWAYNSGPSSPNSHNLVDPPNGQETPTGFSVLVPLEDAVSSPCGPLIFTDGFESGDSSAWSTACPPACEGE